MESCGSGEDNATLYESAVAPIGVLPEVAVVLEFHEWEPSGLRGPTHRCNREGLLSKRG
jgi:hypothetical protein